jgi:hypothetical protein
MPDAAKPEPQDGLKRYRSKRDFGASPERSRHLACFVIHKHAASAGEVVRG